MSRLKSSLVTFEHISPNKNPRNKKIRRLTPHCIAGNLTIESTLKLSAFRAGGTASTNYAIGTDGRVGLGVEETYRAWTSSSKTNDEEAITFEIANNGGAPDWRMSDAAINSWILLSVDICRYYGFRKVAYQPKPTNITISEVEKWINTWDPGDAMIITLHNWFANKACPGPYFIRQLPWMVKEINKRLSGQTSEAFVGEGAFKSTSPTPSTNDVDKSNESVIWNFFKEKGLNAFAIAGIMGNLFAESGLKPTNLQNNFEKSLNMTDEVYTQSVDNGSYKNFVQDQAGYGLAQWTFWSRKDELLKFAKGAGKSIGDITTQLDFLWKELQRYTSMMKILTKAATIKEASDLILLEFERPADQSENVRQKRAEYGQKYYDKFNDVKQEPIKQETAKFAPYIISIKPVSLNIRKGPGVNYPVVKTLINDKNLYTIIEEIKDSDGKKWGKLKSGIGWISLEFTIKV